ncbi:hypothetical protein GF420_05425 [candidate division GN15 bacterium]|nr:hypothetical protein [candidate division GN15 bacterium]
MIRLRNWLWAALILIMSPGFGHAQDIFEIESGFYSTGELVVSKEMGERRRVQIRASDHLNGKLRIETGPDEAAIATYSKQARTDSRSRAFDYIDVIAVSVDLFPDYVRVDLRAPNPPPWARNVESGQVDLRLTLPVDCLIEVEAVYFDVDASGPFREFELTSSLSRLDVTSVSQRLELDTKNQRVTVADVAGDISVSTTNALLSATNIEAPDQAARFRNDGGDINLETVSGQINVKNSFGRIDVQQFDADGESSFIRGSSGPITLEIIDMPRGQLVVSNRYEDIEMSVPGDISAYFSFSVEDDSIIEALNLEFHTDLVKPNRLAFRTGEADVSISGSVRGTGNIYLRGTGRID